MGSGLEQQKPATNTFPKPFIEECKFLETCGFTFEDDNEQKKRNDGVEMNISLIYFLPCKAFEDPSI